MRALAAAVADGHDPAPSFSSPSQDAEFEPTFATPPQAEAAVSVFERIRRRVSASAPSHPSSTARLSEPVRPTRRLWSKTSSAVIAAAAAVASGLPCGSFQSSLFHSSPSVVRPPALARQLFEFDEVDSYVCDMHSDT